MKKIATYILALAALFIITQSIANAGTLQEDRKYQPAVLTAQSLGSFQGLPVNQIYAYSYNAGNGAWSMIPFQIDEMTLGPNPLSGIGKEKWFYFAEVWAYIDSITTKTHNGVFDNHDELVFMVRDMGDRAPNNKSTWIDNQDSKNYARLEIALYDSNLTTKRAYIYLYRSTTLSKNDIPRPYEMSFNEATNTVSTKYYDLTFGNPGMVSGIAIKTPGGSGLDILDRLKLRANVLWSTAFGVLPVMFVEESLYSDSLYYTKDPIVRFIRLVDFSFQSGSIKYKDHAFNVDTKFYPFNGTIRGGSELSTDSLSEVEPEPMDIKFMDLRYSWDYNVNASGMKFYNPYNNGLVVDGTPDNVTTTIDRPADKTKRIPVWNMLSGDQGTVFTLAKFSNTKFTNFQLYYWDNKNGGAADQNVFVDLAKDTGDEVSYGDHGVLMQASINDTLELLLNYTLYMLPEKNVDRTFAEQMAANVSTGIELATPIVLGVQEDMQSLPANFTLLQNYPNPFNNSTRISFALDRSTEIALSIYDTAGRLVKTLAKDKFTAGEDDLHWNGTDNSGLEVPSGMYFYKLEAGQEIVAKKLLLIK